MPALVTDPSPAAHVELARAIGDALGGATVMLADDAFTKESAVAIDRPPLRDPSGNLAQGRERGRPELFTLVKSGAQCLLIHEQTGKRIPLDGVACEPK